MIFKKCLIKLALNNKRLHFETNLMIDFVEELSFFQKKILIWRFLQISIFSKKQRIFS